MIFDSKSYFPPTDTHSRDIYVSGLGKDSKDCGRSKNRPCKTINCPFNKRIVESNDTINIDGNFRYFHSQHILIFEKSVFLTSYNGRAKVRYAGGLHWGKRSFIKVYTKLQKNISVSISNIDFYNMPLVHCDERSSNTITVHLTNCSFEVPKNGLKQLGRSPMGIIGIGNKLAKITAHHCSFDGGQNIPLHFIDVRYKRHYCPKNVTLEIKNSSFHNVGKVLNVAVPDNCSYPFDRRIKADIENIVVKSHPTFINNVPTLDILMPRRRKLMLMKLRIRNSTFEGLKSSDTAAVAGITGLVDARIQNCHFISNHGTGGGALALCLTNAIISKCTFINNKASTKRMCGDTGVTGSGGALMGRGITHLKMTGCTFRNNFAECFGDAVHIVNGEKISVLNTVLESVAKARVFKTSIWQSFSNHLVLDGLNVSLTQSDEMNNKIFIAQSNNFATGYIKPLFVCPVAANMTFDYTKPNELQKKKNKKIASVSCVKCPQKSYSTEFSFGRIDNFEQQKSKIKNIKCQKCPFGAECDKNIVPKKNYWGYENGGLIHIINCPRRYCCQGEDECKRLNSCHGNRMGTLCGQCPKNYTQNIFTTGCTRNGNCKVGKFWVLFFILAFIFVMLLTYLQDGFKLVFRLLRPQRILSMFRDLVFSASKRNGRSQEEDTSQLNNPNEDGSGVLQNEDEENGRACVNSRNDADEQGEILHARWFLHEDETTNSVKTTSLSPETVAMQNGSQKENKSSNSTTGGLIKIMFFYYQLNALLILYTSEVHSNILRKVHAFTVDIFNFQLYHSTLGNFGCAVASSGAVLKTILKSFFPLAMLVVAVTLFTLILIICRVLPSLSSKCLMTSLKSHLLITILQIILLGYSTIMFNIFSLLSCVSLANGDKVLFVDGSILCYQPWQYALTAFVVLWTVPLVLTLHVAQKYLQQNKISEKGFYLALLFPLPFLCYALVSWFMMRKYWPTDESNFDGYQNMEPLIAPTPDNQPGRGDNKRPLRNQLLDVLGSAFRRFGNRKERLSWEPILIGQRLFLLCIHTFLINPVLKAITMLLAMILLAFLNIAVQPYHSKSLNTLNITCVLFLCVNGIVNTVHAYVYSGATILDGPLLDIMLVCDYIETVTMLVFPSIALIAFAMLVVLLLFNASFKCFAMLSVLLKKPFQVL